MNKVEFTVNEKLLPYLINGDTEGLTDDEIAFCESTVEELREDFNIPGHSWHWSCNDTEAYYGYCEILGEFGSVVDIEFVWRLRWGSYFL